LVNDAKGRQALLFVNKKKQKNFVLAGVGALIANARS
jgi:hypothetical protein